MQAARAKQFCVNNVCTQPSEENRGKRDGLKTEEPGLASRLLNAETPGERSARKGGKDDDVAASSSSRSLLDLLAGKEAVTLTAE